MDDSSQLRHPRSGRARLPQQRRAGWKLILGALFCIGLNAGPCADEIYKWKDRDGVHFGSHPPPGGAESVRVSPAVGQAAPDQLERKERTQRMLDAYADERREQSAAREKKQNEQKERQRRCQESKTRQFEYSTAAFLYLTDGQGNRRIVGDAERTKMQAEADAAVSKWCR